jgi:hypothetical protein
VSNVRSWTAQANEGITTSLGQCNYDFAPATLAAIIRPQDLTTYRTLVGAGVDGAGRWLWQSNLGAADHRMMLVCDTATVSRSQSAVAGVVNKWYIVAVSLATTGDYPRFHIINLTDSGAWLHEAGAETMTATGVPTTRVRLGQAQDQSDPFYGDIAAIAAWNTALSDANVETLTSGIYGSPRALWILNQASTITAVTDATGNGANQTALSGTSVVDSGFALPDWSVGGVVPHIDVLVGQ